MLNIRTLDKENEGLKIVITAWRNHNPLYSIFQEPIHVSLVFLVMFFSPAVVLNV